MTLDCAMISNPFVSAVLEKSKLLFWERHKV